MAFIIEWFRRWRSRATPVAPAARLIPRPERTAPHVPAEYQSLYSYLEHRYASLVVLSFDQIEMLLGFKLPAPAGAEPGWWTAADGPAAPSWTGAGRTAVPNLAARTVAFERQA
jgi:hypothetical protein